MGSTLILLTATIYTWRARVRDKVGIGPAWRRTSRFSRASHSRKNTTPPG